MIDMADIRGLTLAKRALEVMVAGGFNLLLHGAPGSGKTMLARRAVGSCSLVDQHVDHSVTQDPRVGGLVPDLGEVVRVHPEQAVASVPHDPGNAVAFAEHQAARKAEVAEIEQIARPNPDNRCHPRGSMTEQTDTADATRFMVPAGCVDARPTAYRAWRSLGYTPMQCLAVVYGQPSLYLLGSECPSARSGASPRHTSRCAVASACP